MAHEKRVPTFNACQVKTDELIMVILNKRVTAVTTLKLLKAYGAEIIKQIWQHHQRKFVLLLSLRNFFDDINNFEPFFAKLGCNL